MKKPQIRRVTPSDRDWLVSTQSALYATEYGFDESFGVLCAQIVDDFMARADADRERGWIAEVDGQPVGAIFCMKISEQTAQLRLFFLTSGARGQGLGKRLLQTCMRFAQSKGYAEMRLWTHRSHAQAVRLYRASGWQFEGAEEAVSFGQNEVIESYSYRF